MSLQNYDIGTKEYLFTSWVISTQVKGIFPQQRLLNFLRKYEYANNQTKLLLN